MSATPAPPGAPSTSGASTSGAAAPVTLTYLGVAGWKVADGDRALLVDPYFSRENKGDKALVSPNEATIARYAPARADGILITHSHADHVLDAPSVAKRTGAMLIGSESTLNLGRASGVSEQRLMLARGGESLTIGPFSVRPVRALHGVYGADFAPGSIPRDVKLPMAFDHYALGDVFQYVVRVSGRTIMVVGSPNFIESEIEGLRPDVAIVAGPTDKVPDYACRLMRAIGKPRLVLANHFDNHGEPLGPKQMDVESERRADLAEFEKEIHACAPQTKFVVPAHFQPISI